MAELTYFSVISRVDGSSGKRRITIHPKIEGGRRSTDVHQVNAEQDQPMAQVVVFTMKDSGEQYPVVSVGY